MMFDKIVIDLKKLFPVMFIFLAIPAFSEPSPKEIVERSLTALYASGEDQKVDIIMNLINSKGQERTRELTMLRMNMESSKHQKYYIYFHSPADVKGTAFLIDNYLDKDDDRRLYIPSIKLIKRISANDKRSSFAGSDFTYEDVSGRNIDDDEYTIIETTTLNDRPVYLVESRPKQPIDYVLRRSWIDSERSLPLKEDFYNEKNQLYKTFTAEKIEKLDGYWTITRRVMEDVMAKHKTLVEYKNVLYDTGLDEDIFKDQSLRRPPVKWVQ